MPAGTSRITNMENKIEELQKKQKLKICAYNVHGLFNKINYPYFFTFFNNQDLFYCLETHVFKSTEQKQLSNRFPNHNLFWKPAIRSAVKGRGVGGILIGWKKNFSSTHNIKLKVVNEEDITVVVLKKQNFELNVLPLYIRSEAWENEFTKIKNYIAIKDNMNFLLLGDVNARLGELPQMYIPELHSNPRLLNPRVSKDKIINRRGRLFMELCSDQNLWLLNGACYGDEEGSFTYSSAVGDSVIDLAAISISCLDVVESFNVENAYWSDHFPVVVNLVFRESDTSVVELSLLPKLRWKKNQQESYCRKLEDWLT